MSATMRYHEGDGYSWTCGVCGEVRRIPLVGKVSPRKQNRALTSLTKSLERHMRREHPEVWLSEEFGKAANKITEAL